VSNWQDRIRLWSLAHLARPQPAQRFVPQIDGLRFVAIISVIFYHLQGFVAKKHLAAGDDGGWLNALFAQGHFGVPLFFALSGYILCGPFLGDRAPRLRDYFMRRLTRLEPPYLISLLLVFALKLWALDYTFPELFPHLLASLVYAHGMVFGTHSEVNGVAWSLEVEWQFYLLAPLLFALLVRQSQRARVTLLWVLMILGGLVHANQGLLSARLGLSLFHYFGFFAAGVWVAVSEASWRAAAGGRRFDLLGIVAGLSIVAILLAERAAAITLLPALTALLLVAGLRGSALRRVLGWWPLHCIGAMCYSIYLYHFFVISFVGKLMPDLGAVSGNADLLLLAAVVFITPIVLVCCTIPYLLIERPFMIWRPGKNRLIDAFRGRINPTPVLAS
jgi:peptidoglycan/LPS O-acetylase OafA/YrhL